MADRIIEAEAAGYEHSGLNGHWIECKCDLCQFEYPHGFYTCECDYCDPECTNDNSYDHECRHNNICECGDVYNCTAYPHVFWKPGDILESRCDCRICQYDPMFKCESECPVCSFDIYVKYAFARYMESRQDEQPIIIGTRESPLFKYEIEQWLSPAFIFVVATPKFPPYVPAIETLVLDVTEAHKEIDEQISAESKPPMKLQTSSESAVKSRKWSDIPKVIEQTDPQRNATADIPSQDDIQLRALRQWNMFKCMDVNVSDWPTYWADYQINHRNN